MSAARPQRATNCSTTVGRSPPPLKASCGGCPGWAATYPERRMGPPPAGERANLGTSLSKTGRQRVWRSDRTDLDPPRWALCHSKKPHRVSPDGDSSSTALTRRPSRRSRVPSTAGRGRGSSCGPSRVLRPHRRTDPTETAASPGERPRVGYGGAGRRIRSTAMRPHATSAYTAMANSVYSSNRGGYVGG